MNKVKLYNVIFPIWFLMFFPPVILFTLVGNFIIDSLVVIACYYLFRITKTSMNLKTFYRKSIFLVWIFGFLADIMGVAILIGTGILGNHLGIPYEWTSAINFDPFSHPMAVLIIVLAMLVSGLFIFLFNYTITFRKLIEENKLKLKIALTIAIITIPWTFMLPTKWFYHGF